MNIIKMYDIRKTDLLSGKKIAPSREERVKCDCCGTNIYKVYETEEGFKLGIECKKVCNLSRFKYPQLKGAYCNVTKNQMKWYLSKIQRGI